MECVGYRGCEGVRPYRCMDVWVSEGVRGRLYRCMECVGYRGCEGETLQVYGVCGV